MRFGPGLRSRLAKLERARGGGGQRSDAWASLTADQADYIAEHGRFPPDVTLAQEESLLADMTGWDKLTLQELEFIAANGRLPPGVDARDLAGAT